MKLIFLNIQDDLNKSLIVIIR